MLTHVTFRELATIICEIDGRDAPDAIEGVTQQIRGAHQRGLINVVDAVGPRGALLLNRYEACRARLLLALIDTGAAGDELAKLNAFLAAETRTVLADGTSLKWGLRAAVDGIAAGEQWVLRVNVVRDRLESGEIRYNGKLLRAWEAEAEDPTLDLNLYWLEATLQAFIKIPASRMLSPIIERFADA